MFYLALTYAYSGELDKAKNILNNLNNVKLNNLVLHDLAVACYNLGKELSKRGKYSDALYYLDKAVHFLPKNAGFWYKKGEVHYYLKEIT